MRRVLFRWPFRWAARLAAALAWAALTGVVVLACLYAAGVPLPLHGGMAPLSFENWNGSRSVEAELGYSAALARRDGRALVTAELEMPESVRVLRDYLDGGRRLLATCGPQKLYLRRLGAARISVEKPLIRLAGTAELELDGPITARDSRPVAASVETGFDRATLWARLAWLDIDGVPRPMVEAIARQAPRRVWTREQVLDLAKGALSPELAELLARHGDRLDLAFEDLTPRMEGDRLTVDATFSLDEAAVLGLLADRVLTAPLGRVAALLAPGQAHAQLPALGGLRRQLEGAGRRLEGTGRAIGRQFREGGDPAPVIGGVLGGITEPTDCWSAF